MSPKTSPKPLLRALMGEVQERPPFWLMRQAGRYLPEYRSIRQRAPDFLALCRTPELATEITLQPVNRFGMDGAILFSDILMVPFGLTQPVAFKEGEGPVLEPLVEAADLQRLKPRGFRERVAAVAETVRQVKAALPPAVTLLGFCGAPWTVATYMVEGGTSKDFARIKAWMYRDPDSFGRLIELLIDVSVDYLSMQIEAGAEAVQLFDSWAGVLSEPEFARWVIAPNAKIVSELKKLHPNVPVIAFPRGAGVHYKAFAKAVPAAAIGLDSTVPIGWARTNLQKNHALQGNLDPLALVAGGAQLEREVRRIVRTLGRGPFIFNLGHGVLPQTPPTHVAALAALLKSL